MSRSRILQQLTYLLPGALLTFWLDTPTVLLSLLDSPGASFARSATGLSLLSGAVVVSLFLYVLFFPVLKGVEQPNYRQWRADGELSVVIPLLTAAMVTGWSLLWSTLAYYTELGAWKGLLGAIGLYLTVFGILGLIPVPARARARRRSQ